MLWKGRDSTKRSKGGYNSTNASSAIKASVLTWRQTDTSQWQFKTMYKEATMLKATIGIILTEDLTGTDKTIKTLTGVGVRVTEIHNKMEDTTGTNSKIINPRMEEIVNTMDRSH